MSGRKTITGKRFLGLLGGTVGMAALSCCGLTVLAARQTVSAHLDPVRAVVEPASVGLFAGKMDYGRLSWLDRTIAKVVGSSEGDWRDWDAIRAWALELRPALLSV